MPVQLTGRSIVSCDGGVVSCDLAGGAALLDLSTGTYFSINSVGAFVWAMLRNPIAVSEIQNALVANYDVEKDKCFEDLSKLLKDLSEAGLIVIADAPAC
jgi:Coenzyme PQQ synthesis protein D (PqqD)